MDKDHIKIIFLGESGVGKTCLHKRFDSGLMGNGYYSFSANYFKKRIKVNGKDYECDIWDTPGSEKFRALSKIFIRDSDIVVLVYDISKKKSFIELQYWLDSVIDILGKEIYLILVGNKSDLYENEEVTEETGKKFAQIIKAKFSLISAMDNPDGWNNFFENAIKEYINYIEN